MQKEQPALNGSQRTPKRTFVISDIHGAHRALIQCLERVDFDYAHDQLICLGDTVDGYPDTKLCFDELLKISHLVYILGNHDDFLLQYFEEKVESADWPEIGEYNTKHKYQQQASLAHREFLSRTPLYYETDNMLFVHAGFETGFPMEMQDRDTLLWDRVLVYEASRYSEDHDKITNYQKVFLGHTPTLVFNSREPMQFCEIRLLDTGAGYGGKLTIMNAKTDAYVQSDTTKELYGYVAR